jgi:NDP-sugar pyrophosphorylase family protein
MMPPVAILAGGLATRMRPMTESIPKGLIEVAGKPFLVHQVELLRGYGLTEIVLCIGYKGEMIEAVLGDGSAFGVNIRYSHDGAKLLGTGGALKRALPMLGDSFFITYGDAYLETDYRAIAQQFASTKQDGLMVVYKNDGQWDSSNVIYQDGQIIRYDKLNPTPEMHYIDYGVGMLRAAVFEAYADEEAFDLASVYSTLVEIKEMAGYETDKRFYEIGSPSGLAETEAYLRSQR